MRKILAIISSLILLTTVYACGGEEGFIIKCEIEGLGTHGLEMVYATRDGLSKASFHPVDGKVELKGQSVQPTLVEVFTIDGELLFSCVAQNGDEMKLKMKLGQPGSLVMTGQDASRDFTAFVAQHDSLLRAGSDAQVNQLIADWVRANPANMASTLLMVTKYRTDGYELEADSLMSDIAPQARPALLSASYASTVGTQVTPSVTADLKVMTLRIGLDSMGHDTLIRFVPSRQSYTLLAFTDERKPDTLTKRMRDLRKDHPKRRLNIIELSLSPDSTLWRSQIMNDSMNWWQAWLPGSAAAREIRQLAVPHTPYYIVADSNGKQLYRGKSLLQADTMIRSRLEGRKVAETDSL